VLQKQITSARVPQPVSVVSFDFTNKRDPFKPYVQAPVAPAAPGKPARKMKDLLPIQTFDTEKFKVTGIITGIRENSALILDPSGKGYVVREGMLVGSNDGKIRRITNSTVEVEEVFRDDSGRMKKRLVKLTLTRKK
jgi:type IV pilus assembly protein PilP